MTRLWNKCGTASCGEVLAIFFALLLMAPQCESQFLFRTHTFQGVTLPYRLFVPSGYTATKKYPIVLALHGSGERGSDNSLQLTANRLATSWADAVNQTKYPCFVVAPQCPADGNWSNGGIPIRNELAAANDILTVLAKEYSLDTNRFYVTGLSMGGYGTWELIAQYPDRFAAAIPMSAGLSPGYADRILGMPIWNFHGAVDNIVPVSNSRGIINALQVLGKSAVYTHCNPIDCSGLADASIASAVQNHADFFYTEYQSGGHVVWNESYDYKYLFPWVFDKCRQHAGAVSIDNLNYHRTLSGTVDVVWSTPYAGGLVEVWLSTDAGRTFTALNYAAPNTGTYTWNSATVGDCSFAQIKIYVKDANGNMFGSTVSAFFSIKNTPNGPPFAGFVMPALGRGAIVDTDSLDISFLLGDPEWTRLTASISYSADDGKTYQLVTSFEANADTLVQSRRISVAGLPNGESARLRLMVSDGNAVGWTLSQSFIKRTPRVKSLSVDHVSGAGGTVAVHVVNGSVLTGHRYGVTFKDSTALGKYYTVRDLDRGVNVVPCATQLDGVTEGPVFDGLSLVVENPPAAAVDPDSTRWIKGGATMPAVILILEYRDGATTVRGYAEPSDYLITLFPNVMDTSISAFGVDPTPMKFTVWNRTKNRKASIIFWDADADHAITSGDVVYTMEPDSTGKLRICWSIQFLAETGDVLPVSGDVFLFKTKKPITVQDVYQFTGSLMSVPVTVSPIGYSLDQNFPNPFNPATTIGFSMPRAQHVQLTLHNVLGQRIGTLIDKDQDAGYHTVQFHGGHLSSGVYFYRIETEEFVQVRKLVLLK